ncbi:hypothetical protein JB92DRAFT_559964 [Gautieria morchelliformis]|nr:hypothetical protein JB92DRAFT_559964 [Gautieria morchelliformis]
MGCSRGWGGRGGAGIRGGIPCPCLCARCSWLLVAELCGAPLAGGRNRNKHFLTHPPTNTSIQRHSRGPNPRAALKLESHIPSQTPSPQIWRPHLSCAVSLCGIRYSCVDHDAQPLQCARTYVLCGGRGRISPRVDGDAEAEKDSEGFILSDGLRVQLQRYGACGREGNAACRAFHIRHEVGPLLEVVSTLSTCHSSPCSLRDTSIVIRTRICLVEACVRVLEAMRSLSSRCNAYLGRSRSGCESGCGTRRTQRRFLHHFRCKYLSLSSIKAITVQCLQRESWHQGPELYRTVVNAGDIAT